MPPMRAHPRPPSRVIEGGSLVACPWCATTDLYIQKDFPQGLGLLIVIVGFAISTVFWYLEMPIVTYLVLLSSALLDMFLYYRVPDVTICYRCLSQVAGAGLQSRVAVPALRPGRRRAVPPGADPRRRTAPAGRFGQLRPSRTAAPARERVTGSTATRRDPDEDHRDQPCL